MRKFSEFRDPCAFLFTILMRELMLSDPALVIRCVKWVTMLAHDS